MAVSVDADADEMSKSKRYTRFVMNKKGQHNVYAERSFSCLFNAFHTEQANTIFISGGVLRKRKHFVSQRIREIFTLSTKLVSIVVDLKHFISLH